jgi:hypothetical protein
MKRTLFFLSLLAGCARAPAAAPPAADAPIDAAACARLLDLVAAQIAQRYLFPETNHRKLHQS